MKAFKDWSYIVHALGTGEQTIILRKGGIHENSGEFEIEANEFLLLPTLFHQAKDKVKSDLGLDESEFHKDHLSTSIKYLAKVESTHIVKDRSVIDRLKPFHIWNDEVVNERFERWNANNVYCLVLRVYELGEPISIEMTPELGGCKSWVDINVELTENHRAVMDNSRFKSVLKELKEVL